MVIKKGRGGDRRIQKTQKLLHEALDSLIHEKPYDSIVVKEILERANVGRSTFYTHYRDKDELLASGIGDMIHSVTAGNKRPASGKWHERVISFSLPLFEHVDQRRRTGAARMGERGRAVLHEHLQKALSEQIADDFKKNFTGRRKTPARIPSELLVRYVASTFILVLNWWVESASPLGPKEADTLFRALILPTLTTGLE